ncbi:hypothetical protein BDY17DRAFT_351244 [Neohortaea acidophila]|uniref:Uncharacterized protein n=1 Tax=Neohortaea acidophila TaxID=245834 RepID=A0A6A6Q205_9PEZI|nr:uncharacterized protein BDY17DRAFT_351244 [Neohortaea acidophila]KAF2486315.1 hypothetical protein BDY17DRAFT_351244 [Neohortaea acidophila]
MVMASFDELVEQLLYDVALSGSKGIAGEDIEKAVKTYYDSQKPKSPPPQQRPTCLLFSDAPPSNLDVVDSVLVQAVWTWMERHPDVEVKEVHNNDQSIDGVDAEGQPLTANESSPTTQPNPSTRRIFTSEERVWHAIAGHGVDTKRLPAKEFDLLSIIAAHGPDGILQPDVTRLSQQDKRSVPKRTDELAKKGYITKDKVIAAKAHTAILKLSKYATKQDARPQHVQAFPNNKGKGKDNNSGIIYYDEWFSETIRILRENNGIAALEDLRAGLGIFNTLLGRRAYARAIRRLELIGVARKLKAKVESGSGAGSEETWVRCVQLLREPSEADRLSFHGYDSERASKMGPSTGGTQHELDTEADSNDETPVSHGDEEENYFDAPLRTGVRPQWSPDMPAYNFILNIVDGAGVDGISSMDLHARSMGMFWMRPLDEIMARLTDVWQTSQPPHLRHLAIVRDTGVQGKLSHYKYYTLHNFEKAVQAGRAEWTSVTVQQKAPAKPRGLPKTNTHNAGQLDAWGFPQPDPRLFAGRSGSATLRDCQAAARRDTGLTDTEQGVEGALEEEAAAVVPLAGKKRKHSTLETLAVDDDNAQSHPDHKDSSVGPIKRVRRTATESSKTATSVGGANRPDVPATNGNLRSTKAKAAKSSRTIPGVYIDAADAKELRFAQYTKLGRKPLNMVVVFKSDKLKTLPCFGGGSAALGGAAQASAHEDDVLREELVEILVDEDVPEEDRLPRTRQRVGVPVEQTTIPGLDSLLPSSTELARSFPEEPQASAGASDIGAEPFAVAQLAALSKKRKRGRPSNAERAERARLAELQAARKAAQPVQPRTAPANLARSQQPQPQTTASTANSASGTPKTAQSPTPSAPVMQGLHSKEFTRQHPDVKWVHRGNGKYAAVVSSLPQSRDGTSQPEPTVNETGNASDEAPAVTPSSTQSKDGDGQHANADPHVASAGISHSQSPSAGENVDGLRPRSEGLEVDEALSAPPVPSNTQAKSPSINDETSPTVTEEQVPEANHAMSELTPQDATDSLATAAGDDTMSDDENPDELDNLPELVLVDIDASAPTVKVSGKAGVNRHAGTVRANRMQIVLDTMNAARGAFPGSKNMYYPFRTAWSKKYNQQPDRHTAENVVDELVKQRQLNKYEFGFVDKNGTPQKHDILTLPNVLSTSMRVRRLQKSIIDAYPRKFLPKSVEIEDDLLEVATRTHEENGRLGGPVERFPKNGDATTQSRPYKGLPQNRLRDWGTFPTVENVTVRRLANASHGGELPSKATRKASVARHEKLEGEAMQRLLMLAPLQTEYASSGTIGTAGAIGFASDARASLQSFWKTYEAAPRDLADLLHRAQSIEADRRGKAMRTRDKATSVDPEDAFDYELAQVYLWEESLVLKHSVLAAPAKPTFINHHLTAPHVCPINNTGRTRGYEFWSESSPFTLSSLKKCDSEPRPSKRKQKSKAPATAVVPRLDPGPALAPIRPQPAPRPHAQIAPRASLDPMYHRYLGTPLAPASLTPPSTAGGQIAPIAQPAEPRQPNSGEARCMSCVMRQTPCYGGSDTERCDLCKSDGSLCTRVPSDRAQIAQLLGPASQASQVANGQEAQRPIAPAPAPLPVTLSALQQSASQTQGCSRCAKVRKTCKGGTAKVRCGNCAMTGSLCSIVDDDYVKLEKWGRLRTDGKKRKQAVRKNNKPEAEAESPPAVQVSSSGSSQTGDLQVGDPQNVDQSSRGTKRKLPAPTVYKSRKKAKGADVINGEAAADVVEPPNTDAEYRPRASRKRSATELYPIHAPKRSRAKAIAMVDHHRYNTAVALVRLLCGEPSGDSTPHWEIVAHALAFKYAKTSLIQHWEAMSNASKRRLGQLEAGLHDPILAAYEKGDIKDLDFDNLQEADWPALVRWGEVNMPLLTEGSELQDLPKSREALEHGHEVTLKPIQAQSESESNATELAVAKSWARATALTKDDDYNIASAATKLRTLDGSVLQKATDQLEQARTLVRKRGDRQLPGRNYVLSTQALAQFQRWPGKDTEAALLTDAAQARTKMVEDLQNGDQISLESPASGSTMLAMMNMVAQGHLTPRATLSESALAQAKDKTAIDSPFEQPVIFEQGAKFTAKHNLTPGVQVPRTPLAPLQDATPVWIDINGNLITDIWAAVLRSILHVVAFKPGSTAEGIEKAHKGHFWVWEVELVLAWMEKTGLVLRFGAGREVEGLWKGGWRASEWWYCAFSPEIAVWEATTGGEGEIVA